MKKILIFIGFLLFFGNLNAKNADFSQEINEKIKNPEILGSYELNLFTFHIYDIKLFVEKGKNYENFQDGNFAINIIYDKNFDKDELVEASIDEIERIKKIDKEKIAIYKKYLNEIFVDVKKSDKKTALITKNGIFLYFNEKLVGKIVNQKFARQFALDFADIWLDKNAKYQKMRNSLLNIK